MLTDEEIARRLRLVVAIRTAQQEVRNEIVEVRAHEVILLSEGGGGERRTITYDAIRSAGPTTPTTHGVITRVLAQILGIYRGDYE